MPRTTLKLSDAVTYPADDTTLGHHVARAARRAIICCVLLAGLPIAVYLFTDREFGVGDMDMVRPERGANAAPAEPSDAERLLAEHDDDCWQADEMALADLPSAAIIAITRGEHRGDVMWTDDPVLVDGAFGEVLARLGVEGPGVRMSPVIDPIALCVDRDRYRGDA